MSSEEFLLDENVAPETVFRKIRDIGIGGFGTVSEFVHIPSGLHLAGKSICKEFVTPQMIQTLKAEVDIMKAASSLYTVKYYGTFQWEGQTTILMEYCKLGSLRDLMDFRGETLNEDQVCLVMNDVLKALKLLHSKRIIHRDIKGANILLSTTGICKITDFGVSRQLSQSNSFSVSQAGTPYWMAPEVINEEKYSYQADIWSIACTTVELIEGAPPLAEIAPTSAMVEITKGGFAGLREPDKISPELLTFIKMCSKYDPIRRASLDELLACPFIQKASKLDRMEVMKPLLITKIDFNWLIRMAQQNLPKIARATASGTSKAYEYASGLVSDWWSKIRSTS